MPITDTQIRNAALYARGPDAADVLAAEEAVLWRGLIELSAEDAVSVLPGYTDAISFRCLVPEERLRGYMHAALILLPLTDGQRAQLCQILAEISL